MCFCTPYLLVRLCGLLSRGAEFVKFVRGLGDSITGQKRPAMVGGDHNTPSFFSEKRGDNYTLHVILRGLPQFILNIFHYMTYL